MARLLFLCGLLLLALLPSLASAQPVVTSTQACGTLAPSGDDDTARLQSALLKAEAQAAHCLTLSAGTFHISAGVGTLLPITADDFRLQGMGERITVLDFPPVQVLTGRMAGISLGGADDQVQGLTIQGHTFSGVSYWVGIDTTPGAARPVVRDVEISGWWGADPPGGGGIDLYQPWTTNEGQLGGLIDHVYLHDGTGYGLSLTSNGNIVQNSQFTHIGQNWQQHCIYLTGGYNRIGQNTFDGCSGYAIHGYFDVAHLDASGTVIDGNRFWHGGYAAIIAQPWAPEDGTNPHLPAGSLNGRFITITNNTFQDQDGNTALGIVTYVPAYIAGNTFEDVARGDIGPLLAEAPVSFVGNQVRALLPHTGSALVRVRGVGTILADNLIDVAGSDQGFYVEHATDSQISNNTIRLLGVGALGMEINADGVRVAGNTITQSAPDAWAAIRWNGAPQQGEVTGNRITTQGATWTLLWDNPDQAQMRVHHNVLRGRLDQSGPGLIFSENDTP